MDERTREAAELFAALDREERQEMLQWMQQISGGESSDETARYLEGRCPS